MIRTINLSIEIPPSREFRITLPDDVPAGPAEIVMVVSSSPVSRSSNLGDLANSEFFGMWRERKDLGDSVEFARGLGFEPVKGSIGTLE
jgi:hypothetical protein